METADSTDPSIKKVPYTGITFVGIPEFQSLGTVVGQNISGLVAGKASIEETLKSDSRAHHETRRLHRSVRLQPNRGFLRRFAKRLCLDKLARRA
jgi:hypothetical protein